MIPGSLSLGFQFIFMLLDLGLGDWDGDLSPVSPSTVLDPLGRKRRWTDLRTEQNQTQTLQNLIPPSKVFCPNGGSPVSLGGAVRRGDRQGTTGVEEEDSSIFHPQNQTLRFNKRYTKTRDLLFYQNDGEKLTFQFSDVDSSDASVRGENWDEEYIFAKGQFQWSHNFLDGVGGAGHRVNGRVYPVEMELLHYRRSDGSLEKAWTTGGVLILSILMRLVSNGVPALSPLLSNIPYVAQPGPLKLLHAPVNFRQLLPTGDGYFLYKGSYTFSPCHQQVQRIVFETPIEIDAEQMHYFQYLLYEDKTPMKNNFGALQPLNGRPVSYFSKGFTITTRERLLNQEQTSHKHGEIKRRQFVGSGT